VILWDLRQEKPAKFIHGPLICGDGIDTERTHVLTSSWTATNQLSIWDIRNCSLISNVDWE